MFWRFGGYANISTIDTLLEKQDVTLEELLDESDLIQELKQHNTKLIEFLRDDKVLEKLLEYVVAPKLENNIPREEVEDDDESEEKTREREAAEDDDDEAEKKRNRYAYVSAEVLSSDTWSISEALVENQVLLRKFWDFLKLPAPLDPLQASYFTKVNEALLDKKTEEMLELFKSLDGAVKDMLQHVDSPMVMDLLLKIISLEKAEGGQGIVDWLHSQDLMPTLLSFLSSEHAWGTQTSAGDFLKAIITISANASQNEQSCIGPNELTRQLVSQPCVEKLISDMLKGGNPLTVGVGIVIEVIRKNNSDYDPDVGADSNSPPTNRDPIYLGTLLRMFAKHVPDFMELILSPNHTIGGGDGPVTIKRKELNAAFGGRIEPLGFDRFKTCELMAELLHCSNMGLLNERGGEEFVKARDAERERLKLEGKLNDHNDEGMGDDMTMRSSIQSRIETGSPEGRRLEIANASEDDGFEEVTHAGALGDEPKDDFDEKPEGSSKPETSLSFMDKDDAEFVDEPLSSPRLKPEPEETKFEHAEDVVEPLSPSKETANEIQALSLNEAAVSAEPAKSNEETASEAPESTTAHAEPPKSPVEGGATETPSVQVNDNDQTSQDLPANPEDTVAPLSIKKAEPTDSNALSVESGETSHSTETVDTTMGEAGDSSNSVIMVNADEQHIDDTTNPVVGDYLKMQFVEHKVVPTILDFFFRFPWNNFLHNVVYDVVQQVFNGPMERGYNRTLAIDLFDTGDISMRIVDGQKKSDEAQAKNRMRLGYMGHLTLIAEEVVKFTERHPPELLSESLLEKVMNTEWITYVEVTLAETRERDNAILGGVRPDMSVGPRQAVMNAVNAATGFGNNSSALSDAGLNGSAGLDGSDLSNGNGANGGFALTGGSLLSGFGSSSDEEDEEMEDENEEDRSSSGVAEFSRYISTPSTTTATSDPNSDLEPPSAPPPPPPPLNIPPSRARRQLAARLALHSKQASENEEELDRAEEEDHRISVNPFATDEDDDDDDDGVHHEEFTIGDLEAEEEGKGRLPPGTPLVGGSEDVKEAVQTEHGNVGMPLYSSSSQRLEFPASWPFGVRRSSHSQSQFSRYHDVHHQDRDVGDDLGNDDYDYDYDADYASVSPSDSSDSCSHEMDWERASPSPFSNSSSPSTSFNISSAHAPAPATANAHADFDPQSSDSDSDDGHVGQLPVERRLSTVEATRRTSLEDDDDDDTESEVVHVARERNDDDELVEVHHAEMQGVEGGH